MEQACGRLPEPDGDGEGPNEPSESSAAGSDPRSGDGPDAESDSDALGNERSGDSTRLGNDPGHGSTDTSDAAPSSHDPCGAGEVMDAPDRAGEGSEPALPETRRALEEQEGQGHAPGREPRQGGGQAARRRGGDRARRALEPAGLAHGCCAAT